MKLSKTKTDWIAIAAFTGSEWDSVNCVLLNITPVFLNQIQDRMKAARRFNSDPSFSAIEWYDGPDGWYNIDPYTSSDDGDYVMPEDTDEVLTHLQSHEWCYVEVTEEEMDEFGEPESSLASSSMQFFKDGDFKFSCYGKHTSEEFWTGTVDTETLLLDAGIITHLTKGFMVLCNTAVGWEPVFKDSNDALEIYPTMAIAWEAIRECLADVKDAVSKGDMEEEYNEEDYFVVAASVSNPDDILEEQVIAYNHQYKNHLISRIN